MKTLCFVVGCILLPWLEIGLDPSYTAPQAAPAAQQNPSAKQNLLVRKYREGETLAYLMIGKNEAWSYQIEAQGVVKKSSTGAFVEEISWSHLTSDGAAIPLPSLGKEASQELTLDFNSRPALPDFSSVTPILIGPMSDLVNFYSDLWLAARVGNLEKAGDHTYFKMGGANSWADGQRVVLGEDSIDFDLTLAKVSPSEGMVTLLVRHVPPKEPKIKLTADWMRVPVADTPNNWVEVKKQESKYIAEVGKETFDVQIQVSLADGKIVAATLDNPVVAIQRECVDAALTSCGEAKPRQIRRQIELRPRDHL